MRFLDGDGKDWVTKARINRKIFMDGKWMRLRDYVDSLNLRNMTAYCIYDRTYFKKGVTTKMKNVRRVQVIVSN